MLPIESDSKTKKRQSGCRNPQKSQCYLKSIIARKIEWVKEKFRVEWGSELGGMALGVKKRRVDDAG